MYDTSRTRPSSTCRPSGALERLQHPHLLGPDGDPPSVALHDVRHAHEAGHELVGRVLVDVGGRAHLLDRGRR